MYLKFWLSQLFWLSWLFQLSQLPLLSQFCLLILLPNKLLEYIEATNNVNQQTRTEKACCPPPTWCYSIGGPLSFFLPHVTLKHALEETGMISCYIMPWPSSFLFPLSCHDFFLGQNPRSRSANLYL